MRKKAVILMAMLLLFLGAGVLVKAAEEWPESGKCGADITWKYEKITVDGWERDTLVLTGNGAMTNEYLEKVNEGGTWHYETKAPWSGRALYGITLDDRITTIGDGAFGMTMLYDPYQAESSEEVYGTFVIPKNVTSIGKLAFDNAYIGTVYIGPKVTKVGEQAFFCCRMKDLYVASSTLDFDKEQRVLAYSTLETIHAPKGSKAESYAKAHDIGYEEWDGTDYGKTGYTLTLDAGEGAFPEKAQSSCYTVSPDQKTAVRTVSVNAASVPAPDIAPALEGKYFGGWYLGNELFDFETTALRQDTVLTAKWLTEPDAPVLTLKSDSEWSVTLSWDMRMDAELKGYRVYRADTADAAFVQQGSDLPSDRVSYTDNINEKDILKKMAYRYYIEAVYEKEGAETPVRSKEVSCNGMLANAELLKRSGGLYVGVKLTNAKGEEISSLTLHEGETGEELFPALIKGDGTLISWEHMEDFSEDSSVQWGLGLPYPARFPMNDWSEDIAPFAYAKFPTGYLGESYTRLKGMKATAGQQLYLYVQGNSPGFLTAIPVTVETAEEGVTYPSYDKDGIVADDLQAGLNILRDAVRSRETEKDVYIKKSACDPSIEAYDALRAQDKSDNPSGDGRGGLIPDWFESELYDINKNRAGMKPWEGDYAFYAIRASSSNADMDYPDNIYGEEYYHMKLDVEYTTTKEQEAAVDAKVQELLSGRLSGLSGKSEYARAKAVYEYVSTSMHYDNSDPVHHYAYGGLCKGKATCMGFALSFQRLASELGLESKIIMGLDRGAHTYNIVKIQEKYYYLDCSAKKFLKGKKNFSTAKLQDRYLSTAFQTYYMANISETDYAGGQDSALGGSNAITALTDEQICALNPEYEKIAYKTDAKYTIKGTNIAVTPVEKDGALKPVYDKEKDASVYMLAFRLQLDAGRFGADGTVVVDAGGGNSLVYQKGNPAMKDGYIDVLLPLTEGNQTVTITVDNDSSEEGVSQYEAQIYVMDLSAMPRASVRESGVLSELRGEAACGVESSSPLMKYESDKEVTAVYEAVAWSSEVKIEGITEGKGNYAALRLKAPEAMQGTKSLKTSAEVNEGTGCLLKWAQDRSYLDCFCKLEENTEQTFTVTWAGAATQKQTVTIRTAQDCYMETDASGADGPKKIAFNGLSATMYVGQEQIADVKITKAYERDRVQLSYTVDQTDVLSVNRVTGQLRALSPGKATLTVRAADVAANGRLVTVSKKITVKATPAPSGVKITNVKDRSASAVWKKNTNSRFTEGYAVPYTTVLGGNAKEWKKAVEAALARAGMNDRMLEDLSKQEREELENALSGALCQGTGRVILSCAQTESGGLQWENGLITDTPYVFYLRSVTENVSGEMSFAGYMSGKITTKKPVLTEVTLQVCDASGTALAPNDAQNECFVYTDPAQGDIPAAVKYLLTTADSYESEKDVYKSVSYKSTNAKAVKVNNKGELSLGGQAGTAEIYVTGKDSTGAVRESGRVKIRIIKSASAIKDKTTPVALGQPVSVQELVGCDVNGAAAEFKLDRVDLAAMVSELETNGKDCFKVTYPAGEKEKAVITPFAYPEDPQSGERKKGGSFTLTVNLYDKAGEGKQLTDTKKAVIKVNDMPAPAVSKVAALDTSAEITFKPNTVVREIDGEQYYYTLTLTDKGTGEVKTYRADGGAAEGSTPENVFTYVAETDQKGQVSYRCRVSGLTSATAYEAVVTAHYLAEPGDGSKEAQKASGVKKFTTLKPVIAAENSMKVSLVSMEELWQNPMAAGQEITSDTVVMLSNNQSYALFAEIGNYDKILGADRLKWSVSSDVKGAAAIKAASDSYTANLTLSRCGTVRVQAVSTLSKKTVCSFTVEVKPYQGNKMTAGGETNEAQ